MGISSAIERLLGPSGSVRRPLAFLLVAVILAGILAPAFLSVRNLSALLVGTSFLIVTTVGEAFVVLMGMIDLGVESVLASAGMLAAFLNLFLRLPGGLSAAVALAFGLATGLVVGLLVTRGRIPSFLVTLGAYWGLRGVALLFNGGNYISPYSFTPPRQFGFTGLSGSVLGVSLLIVISVAVVVLGQVALSYTPFGNWVKSIGSNEASARVVGLPVSTLKVVGFLISGFLAALAGVMITAWQDSIYPLTGQGYSLEAIAGVILGGIPFSGGRGSVVGAALGALIIGVINDVIVLLGLPSLYEYIFVAVILIIAGLQARGRGFVK